MHEILRESQILLIDFRAGPLMNEASPAFRGLKETAFPPKMSKQTVSIQRKSQSALQEKERRTRV